jgi:hypothetical protein
LIYEYALILTFLSLSFILLFSAYGIDSLKELLLIRSSNEGELFRSKNAKLDLWYRLILIFISILCFIRTVLFLFTPTELSKFPFVPTPVIHLLITSFIFQICWALLLFFLYQKKEIRLEERALFLKKTFYFSIIIAISDIIVTLIIFFQSFLYSFTLKGGSVALLSPSLNILYTPLLILNLILLIMLISLFFLYVLRRSMIILKQYWITMLLLIIVTLIYTLIHSLGNLGWYENIHYRLGLFSWSYFFLGWIFLSFIAISVLCNVGSIILYSIMDKFVNPVKYKNQIVSYLKMGFLTALSFTLLAILPNLLLWFYS